MMKLIRYLLIYFAVLSREVYCVLVGDEKFGRYVGGKFWAFHQSSNSKVGTVSIIDPESCEIVDTIKHGLYGSLPSTWADGVYMENYEKDGLVLINSGEPKQSNIGGIGEVYVFSTKDKKAVAQIEVGGRPVHSYGIWNQFEYWVHSDKDGRFYVINLNEAIGLLQLNLTDRIKAHRTDPSHGQLLWDESQDLGSRGFITKAGKPYLVEIDLVTRKQKGVYDFSKDVTADCEGSHSIAYSKINKHLYVECSGNGGIMEIDASAGELKLVHQWNQLNGYDSINESLDGAYIIATHKNNNRLMAFQPGETGQKSSQQFTMNIEGHPSTPSFYPLSDQKGDFVICTPLTENTFIHHRDENGTVVCDLSTGCDEAKTAEDTTHGLCLYDSTGKRLYRVTESAMSNLSNLEFSGACERCSYINNYESEEENLEAECVCTPKCGVCHPNFNKLIPQYDASKMGVRCFNALDGIQNSNGQTVTASLVSTPEIGNMGGAVFQGTRGKKECGFSTTYRNHKRGGIYDASVANIPNNSIQIVNMSNKEWKCQVNLDGPPSRVIYVPPPKIERIDNSPSSTTAQTSMGIVSYGELSFVWIVLIASIVLISV